MADYPWGSMLPAKRIATIEGQISALDKKRADLIEAHKTKLAEFDENDRKLKTDLKLAATILEKETREATVAAATRMFERMLNSPTSGQIDLAELVRKGDFEKILGDAIVVASKSDDQDKPESPQPPVITTESVVSAG